MDRVRALLRVEFANYPLAVGEAASVVAEWRSRNDTGNHDDCLDIIGRLDYMVGQKLEKYSCNCAKFPRAVANMRGAACGSIDIDPALCQTVEPEDPFDRNYFYCKPFTKTGSTESTYVLFALWPRVLAKVIYKFPVTKEVLFMLSAESQYEEAFYYAPNLCPAGVTPQRVSLRLAYPTAGVFPDSASNRPVLFRTCPRAQAADFYLWRPKAANRSHDELWVFQLTLKEQGHSDSYADFTAKPYPFLGTPDLPTTLLATCRANIRAVRGSSSPLVVNFVWVTPHQHLYIGLDQQSRRNTRNWRHAFGGNTPLDLWAEGSPHESLFRNPSPKDPHCREYLLIESRDSMRGKGLQGMLSASGSSLGGPQPESTSFEVWVQRHDDSQPLGSPFPVRSTTNDIGGLKKAIKEMWDATHRLHLNASSMLIYPNATDGALNPGDALKRNERTEPYYFTCRSFEKSAGR
jgi:hypothetical protein